MFYFIKNNVYVVLHSWHRATPEYSVMLMDAENTFPKFPKTSGIQESYPRKKKYNRLYYGNSKKAI